MRINCATRRIFESKLMALVSSKCSEMNRSDDVLFNGEAHSCQEDIWHSINSEIMTKRDTRDNILEKQFHLPAHRRPLVIINSESGNGGHATWNARACQLQGCTHPSHRPRMTLYILRIYFGTISSRIRRLSRFVLEKEWDKISSLQDFNRGFFTTFMAEIKNAASRGHNLARLHSYVDTLDA